MTREIFEALTMGTAEFIASLPEAEKPAAWRTFLKYAQIYKIVNPELIPKCQSC